MTSESTPTPEQTSPKSQLDSPPPLPTDITTPEQESHKPTSHINLRLVKEILIARYSQLSLSEKIVSLAQQNFTSLTQENLPSSTIASVMTEGLHPKLAHSLTNMIQDPAWKELETQDQQALIALHHCRDISPEDPTKYTIKPEVNQTLLFQDATPAFKKFTAAQARLKSKTPDKPPTAQDTQLSTKLPTKQPSSELTETQQARLSDLLQRVTNKETLSTTETVEFIRLQAKKTGYQLEVSASDDDKIHLTPGNGQVTTKGDRSTFTFSVNRYSPKLGTETSVPLALKSSTFKHQDLYLREYQYITTLRQTAAAQTSADLDHYYPEPLLLPPANYQAPDSPEFNVGIITEWYDQPVENAVLSFLKEEPISPDKIHTYAQQFDQIFNGLWCQLSSGIGTTDRKQTDYLINKHGGVTEIDWNATRDLKNEYTMRADTIVSFTNREIQRLTGKARAFQSEFDIHQASKKLVEFHRQFEPNQQELTSLSTESTLFLDRIKKLSFIGLWLGYGNSTLVPAGQDGKYSGTKWFQNEPTSQIVQELGLFDYLTNTDAFSQLPSFPEFLQKLDSINYARFQQAASATLESSTNPQPEPTSTGL